MNIIEKLKNSIIILDGAMGTALEGRGLAANVPPEAYNTALPDEVVRVHRGYLKAGADIICANTFGVNPLKYADCDKIIAAALGNAKRAREGFDAAIALDIGPLGRLLKPLGDLDFEDAVNAFKTVISAGQSAGAELIFFETFNDLYELKAALLAAKECSELPVFASCAFGADGKLVTGASPEAVVALAEGFGVSAVGLNCSLAPAQTAATAEKLISCASVPVIVKPNAGLPQVEDGKTVYLSDSTSFCRDMLPILQMGARCVGGCCGTDYTYIAGLKRIAADVKPKKITDKNLTVVTSYSHALVIGEKPIVIGERINPTGRKKLKQAIAEGDFGYILNEAVSQEAQGAHALDVNVGVAGGDEKTALPRAVYEIQTVTDLPLQIDTSDYTAMERAMRIYNGKPLVNSVNGKKESMEKVFPLVKKYGGVVIALTLDENGIPQTAEGRIAVAKKILRTAEKYGLKSKDIIFDTLATSISADPAAATAALVSLRHIRGVMGVNTSLGVSNISFGLPNRELIGSAFLLMALENGLSAAIINPASAAMRGALASYLALTGADERCLNYIDFADGISIGSAEKQPEQRGSTGGDLKSAIVGGIKTEAIARAKELCESLTPLEIIEKHVVPALDEVGRGFENKTVFLPRLLMSAEAAAAAFDALKEKLPAGGKSKKLKIVLATVEGDVHDIGKNIVRTMLENYGFTVLDLGKDVPPRKIADGAAGIQADLVGLSALMTTTLGAMESTIKLLRRERPGCKIIVGGAVVTEDFAKKIGADAYGKDAMSTVRYAEKLEKEL